MPKTPLDRPHEWISFADPGEDRTWVFDVTFLLSPWTCIFGRGCQGVLTGPAPELSQGCCSYGAHLTDEADVARVTAAAATLTASQWQFRARGRKAGISRTNADGDVVTREVEGACVFLNRPGFAAGPGCALHRAALDRGVPPLSLKPNVCWQLPLRREDEVAGTGHVTSTVRQWDRRDWGDGGFEFHWWCTEAPEAFAGHRPVYQELRDELVELVGPEVYDLVAGYLSGRSAGPASPLVHPAVAVAAPKRRKREKAAKA
ncbi:MAG TPA: hypothetical protein VF954_05165 [Acidimicrobiales bacterium]